MKATDDPLVQAQQLIATARRVFATDVDAAIHNWAVYLASLEDGISTVSRTDALRAFRAFILERFDHHLTLPTRGDEEDGLL